eukprot:scaffold1249_cov122-Isochrysis_galbana.AAC.2
MRRRKGGGKWIHHHEAAADPRATPRPTPALACPRSGRRELCPAVVSVVRMALALPPLGRATQTAPPPPSTRRQSAAAGGARPWN